MIFPESHERISFQLKKKKKVQKTDLSAVPYLEPEPFPLEADGKTLLT